MHAVTAFLTLLRDAVPPGIKLKGYGEWNWYTTHFIDMTVVLFKAPRGLSAEEKRIKLLELFHETVCYQYFGQSMTY